MQQIGPYTLQRKLGQGGMGSVHEAYHPQRGRVAVKVVQVSRLDARAQQRFVQEAQTAARIRHPNVLPVLDAGVHGGTRFYLVMPLVDGESLEQRIERDGPLSARDACRLVRWLCSATSAAHAHGILHRDLKPANVMLPRGGRPLLVDFGVAKDLLRTQSLTSTGEIVGTPSHMSPEQANGSGVDARTDVYGLGALLYHALTGEAPFSGPTLVSVLSKVLGDDPQPPSELADVPANLEAICLRCLAKNPADRYATPDDLARDLSRYESNSGIELEPLRRPAYVSGLVAGLAALAMCGLAAAALWPTGAAPQAPETPTPQPVAERPALPALEPVAVWSGAELADAESLQVEQGALVRFDERGARLHGRQTARPALVVPVSHVRGAFAVEAHVEAKLTPGASCALELRDAEGVPAISLVLRGEPDAPHLRAQLHAAIGGGEATATSPPLAVQSLQLRLRYDPQLGSILVTDPRARLRLRVELPGHLRADTYTLHLGLTPVRSHTAPTPWVCVYTLGLEGAPHGLALRADDTPWARLGRAARRVASGERQEVLSELLELGVNTDPWVRAEAVYLQTVSEPDAAVACRSFSLLWELSVKGGNWFQRRWRSDLHAFSPAARDALAEALVAALRRDGMPVSKTSLANTAAQLVRADKDPAFAALLFHAAGEEASARYADEVKLAWQRAGDPQT